MLSKRGTVARIYLPPDANSLLSVADHCLRSRNYVNLIVIDKQPQLQWLDDRRRVRARGARRVDLGLGEQRPADGEPDVVLACAGDTPTLETVAAAWWLRRHAPELRVRVVNVIDLMTLFAPSIHPHGMSDERFVELFTTDKPVVFAFHGYQFAVHQLVHRRPHPAAFTSAASTSRARRRHPRAARERASAHAAHGPDDLARLLSSEPGRPHHRVVRLVGEQHVGEKRRQLPRQLGLAPFERGGQPRLVEPRGWPSRTRTGPRGRSRRPRG